MRVINSLSEADREGVKLIGMIADRVGGQVNLNRLVSAYKLKTLRGKPPLY